MPSLKIARIWSSFRTSKRPRRLTYLRGVLEDELEKEIRQFARPLKYSGGWEQLMYV